MATAATTEDPEGKRNRTVSLRTAVLATLSALLVGLATSGGALWGVFLTTRSDAEQSRLEFLRPQRQQIYADFLTAADALEAAADAALPFTAGPAPTLDTVEKVNDLHIALERVNARLEMVASDATTDRASVVLKELEFYVWQRVLDPFCRGDPGNLRWCPTTRPETDPSELNISVTSRADFIEQAKRDLGAED